MAKHLTETVAFFSFYHYKIQIDRAKYRPKGELNLQGEYYNIHFLDY